MSFPGLIRGGLVAMARGLRALLRGAVALLILFEEWGWEPLQRLLARLGRLPVLRRLEAAITAAPPWLALGLFALPALALLPVKLGALWLLGQGHAAWGVALIVAAKLLGTALVARLHALTQPALLRLGWYARLQARWLAWKAALLATVHRWPAWRRLQAQRRRWRLRWRLGWRRLRAGWRAG